MIRTPQSTFLYGNFLCYYCFLVVVVFCLVLLLAWVKKYFFLQNFAYLFLSNAVFPFSSWFVTKLLDLQLEIVQRATGRTTETKTEMFLLYHVSPLYAIVIPGVLFWRLSIGEGIVVMKIISKYIMKILKSEWLFWTDPPCCK